MFGRRVAVVACEFDFLAGSIGVAAAERITAAVERATAERLPLVASPSSGGTRMQEGTVAFLQMVKIAAAVELHKQAHLPYLVYLRHPDDRRGVRVVGLARPRHRRRARRADRLPRARASTSISTASRSRTGIQTAENLHRHGVIDGVVPLELLRSTLDRTLTVVVRRSRAPRRTRRRPSRIPDVPAWESVEISRRPDRPGIGYLLRHGTTERVLLSGTGGHGEAATTLLALARFGGQPAVVVGQQRVVGGLAGPQALREARRGMALAAGLRLPLVLVIDTAGPCAVRRGRGGRPGG